MMMDTHGYGIGEIMAWSITRKAFGTCGNFKFVFYRLTDVKTTRSVIEPKGLSFVKFVATTNETDNADVFAGKTLAWTGTADTDVANEIKDSSEVFDPALQGSYAANTADTVGVANPTLIARVDYKDADELYCSSGYNVGGIGTAPFDLCPDGDETYTIYDEHKIQVIAVTANDDGTLIAIG